MFNADFLQLESFGELRCVLLGGVNIKKDLIVEIEIIFLSFNQRCDVKRYLTSLSRIAMRGSSFVVGARMMVDMACSRLICEESYIACKIFAEELGVISRHNQTAWTPKRWR